MGPEFVWPVNGKRPGIIVMDHWIWKSHGWFHLPIDPFNSPWEKIWMSAKGIVIDFSCCKDRMENYDCRRNELEIRDWALMDAPARHPKTSPNESTNSSFFRIVWSKFCSRSEPYQLFREIILPGNVFNC